VLWVGGGGGGGGGEGEGGGVLAKRVVCMHIHA